MATRVKMNSAGIKELLNSPGVRAELTKHAGAVLSEAQANAPVGETGDYMASLHIKQDTTDRAVVRVGSDVAYARVVEARTGNLSRALDARG